MPRVNFTNTQVASSETARDINRGIILNLIRRRQPISRADLARVSGLQRSTVSLIVEQLIHEKWVINGPVGRVPRGRRPTFLRLNDERAIVVADLRPNYTTIAVADVNGRFLSQEAIATPSDAGKTATKLVQFVRQQMDAYPDMTFDGIGITVPGRFDSRTRRVVFAPNLKWSSFDLTRAIEHATGMKVELENAASACVLAEVWFGTAEKVRDLIVVTVSEGIGTGVFANGLLVKGLNGMAGEFGHVQLDPEGPVCGCGRRGCWEVLGSQRAALRYYSESNGPDGLDFIDLLMLAENGDPLALKALEKMARAIGRGIRMLVTGLAPEEIVIVGEFTKMWPRLGPIIQAEVDAATLVGKPPRLRPADDLRMARLRGAVALVLQKYFGAIGGGVEAATATGRSGSASHAANRLKRKRAPAAKVVNRRISKNKQEIRLEFAGAAM
jgi:predicted NBD/HSP70 family sugar kinase